MTDALTDENTIAITSDELGLLATGDIPARLAERLTHDVVRELASEVLVRRRALGRDRRRVKQHRKLRWAVENLIAKVEALSAHIDADDWRDELVELGETATDLMLRVDTLVATERSVEATILSQPPAAPAPASRPIASSTEFDWATAKRAAEHILKRCVDIAYTPPEALDIHRMRVGEVCMHLDAIVTALHIQPPARGAGAAS